MTGIFLVIVVAIWIVFIKWLTPKLVSSIKHARLKQAASVLVFVFLLILPVMDEIIGGFQFRALCETKGEISKIDEEKARGKNVLMELSQGVSVGGMVLKTSEQTYSFIDADTYTVLFTYKVFSSDGGVLIRLLGISETDAPLTFKNVCGPPNVSTIFKRLNMNHIHK